jgi:hypothetical protein
MSGLLPCWPWLETDAIASQLQDHGWDFTDPEMRFTDRSDRPTTLRIGDQAAYSPLGFHRVRPFYVQYGVELLGPS